MTATDIRTVVLSVVDNPASFHDEARFQKVCAACGTSKGHWEAHHVIAKQRCRRVGAPLYSTDNAIRLCAKRPDACHERHTTAQARIPTSCLRDEAIAFAMRWLGRGPAYNYLVEQYAGNDPRIDALLESD